MPLSVNNISQAGESICKQFSGLAAAAVALKNTAEVVTNKGGQLFCAGTTIAAGFASLLEYDLLSGAMQTAIGVREFVNICKGPDNTLEISHLLNDASAGVKMIQTLEEANTQSFDVIKHNLITVKQNVKTLRSQLNKIDKIASKGSKEIKKTKAEAKRLYEEANDSFRDALKLLKNSENSFNESNKVFDKALRYFAPLYAAAHEEEGDATSRLDKFIELAQSIERHCKKGQEILTKGNSHLSEALEKLNHAIEKQSLAAEKTGEALAKAEAHLKLIEEQAIRRQIEEDSEQQINEMFEEIEHVERRNKDKEVLLNQLQNNITDAKNIAEKTFSTFETVVGGGLGGLCGGTFGIAGAIIGAYAGAELLHNKGKITDYVFGVTNQSSPVKPSTVGINFTFDSASSGFWGRYIAKTQSWTMGKVTVNLGGEYLDLRFNLNAKEKVGCQDLYNLQNRLQSKLREGTITKQQCLSIIRELETMEICRRTYEDVVKGFINQDNVYFRELKTICKKDIH